MGGSYLADEEARATEVRDRWRRAQQYELEFWRKYARRVPSRDRHAPRELDYVLCARLEGKQILEVGCGPVGTIFYVPGAMRVGIDPLAREYVAELGFSANEVHLLAGMGERLPLQDDVFDVIICGNVLDHVNQPVSTLNEINRVVKPDGRVMVAVHVIPRWLLLLRRLLDWIDTAHPHHLTASDVYGMIEAAHLKTEDARSTAPRLASRGLKSILANLAMRNLLITCRKADEPAAG